MGRKKLGEILVDAGVLQEDRLRAALLEQRQRGGPLGRLLVQMSYISEEVLVVALSQQLNFPTVDLERVQVTSSVLDLITGEFAEQHGILPINVSGKFLDVAMTDPTNLAVIDELRIRTKLNVRSYIAGPKAMERAIARFYGRGSGVFNPALQLARSLSIEAAPPQRPPSPTPVPIALPTSSAARDVDIGALQQRIATLEALVSRDEEVIKKVLGLLVEKGIATKEELLKRIS
jgi:hypothetical protein